MKKVAIFISSLSGGGMERAMLNLAEYLKNQGATVDFLVASSKGPLLNEASIKTNLIDLSEQKEKTINIRWWLVKSIFSIESLFALILLIRKLPKSIRVIPALVDYMVCSAPDVILSTPTTANLAVLWAAHDCNFNKKVIIREATTLTLEVERNQSLFYKFVRRLVGKWYNRSDVVVCVSNGVCEDLKTKFKVHTDRMIVVANLIDINGIKNKACSKKHDLLINKYKPYILSVGRLDETKDYETLIRAFHEIAKDTEYRLVILGEGSERNKLERVIDRLSLSDRVFLPGFFLNPYPFIKHCGVFALSSQQEGSPNVLREALVLNKKIISTDCLSGVRDILGGGEYGSLVPVGNYKMYSEELYNLIKAENSNSTLQLEVINESSMDRYKSLCLEST